MGIWAFLDARRSQRVKLLAYELTAPFPLATARGHETDYQLSIHYQSAGGDEEVIEAAFVTYLVFANFGKEPIRSQDIAPSNPLRVEVQGVRVLDISLAGAHRDVNRIDLSSAQLGDDRSSAEIGFDFLDFRDGAMIRVLSTDRAKDVRLAGDIIGMPDGITKSDETSVRGPWGTIGLILWILAEVIAFGAVAYVFREVQGEWGHIWLLALPFAAFFGPIIGALVISETVWPTRVRRPPYPQELHPPRWIRRSGIAVGHPDSEMLYPEFHDDGSVQFADDPDGLSRERAKRPGRSSGRSG